MSSPRHAVEFRQRSHTLPSSTKFLEHYKERKQIRSLREKEQKQQNGGLSSNNFKSPVTTTEYHENARSQIADTNGATFEDFRPRSSSMPKELAQKLKQNRKVTLNLREQQLRLRSEDLLHRNRYCPVKAWEGNTGSDQEIRSVSQSGGSPNGEHQVMWRPRANTSPSVLRKIGMKTKDTKLPNGHLHNKNSSSTAGIRLRSGSLDTLTSSKLKRPTCRRVASTKETRTEQIIADSQLFTNASRLSNACIFMCSDERLAELDKEALPKGSSAFEQLREEFATNLNIE